MSEQAIAAPSGRLWEAGRARACGHSSQPDYTRDEMGHGEEVSGGFFVACRDPPKVLDFTKETLNKMAFFVEVSVVRNRGGTIGL